MAMELIPFDGTKYFTSHEDQVALVREALDSREAGFIAAVARVIVRARGLALSGEDARGDHAPLLKT